MAIGTNWTQIVDGVSVALALCQRVEMVDLNDTPPNFTVTKGKVKAAVEAG